MSAVGRGHESSSFVSVWPSTFACFTISGDHLLTFCLFCLNRFMIGNMSLIISKRNENSVVFLVFALFYLSLAILLMPLRLKGIFNTSFIFVPISILFSLYLSIKYYFSCYGKGLGWIEIFIAFYPVILVPVGLASGNEFNYVLTDAIKPLMWIGIIGYYKNVIIDEKYYLQKIRLPILLLTLSSVLTVSFIFYTIKTVGGVKPSATDIVMLFAFFYYVLNYKHLFSVLWFVMFLMGGKIGPLISLLGVFLIKKMSEFSFKFIVIFSIIMIGVVCLCFYWGFDFLAGYLPLMSKFRVFNEYSFSQIDFDLLDSMLFGGRLSEITSSISIFNTNKLLFFTGPGVGYTYDWIREGLVFEKNRHGVHFSPISILVIYGPFYTLIFYTYLFRILLRAMIIFNKSSSKIMNLFSMFFVANLINSFTVYSIFVVVLFPIAIGIILNKRLDMLYCKDKK